MDGSAPPIGVIWTFTGSIQLGRIAQPAGGALPRHNATMRSGPPLKVLIADDHPLFRDGLARHVQQRSDLALVGEAGNGQEALALIAELTPDVAVLDLKMPRLDGIQICARASSQTPDTKLMILSAYTDSGLVFSALAAGAKAFLSKYAEREELLAAIIAVGHGQVVIPRALHPGIAAEIRTRGTDSGPTLSLRELDVLQRVADGGSAAEIARQLHLSSGTVKTHLQHVYAKLGVSDRAAAVAAAMRLGILQ